MVTTQFISGKLGFGAVVAVLVSTMGDAAFLLIASEPKTGLAMMAMGVIVGTASGRIINLFHADDFLRPKPAEKVKSLTAALLNLKTKKRSLKKR